MKRIVKINIILILLLGLTTNLNAQNTLKIGHINSNILLSMMPGIDTAEAKLEERAKYYERQYEIMRNEYNTKLENYMAKAENENLSDLEMEIIEDELKSLQERIEKFQGKAPKNLEEEKAKLYDPIIKRAQAAIDEVARENGYTYIIDTGYGILVYFEESDDILPLVIKKLGIEDKEIPENVQ